ncbi:MAG: hypothetical protein AAGH65_09675 [Pseudomonadota bacterium]
MADWIESGRVLDWILVLIVAEAALLGGLWITNRLRILIVALLSNLAAGAGLVLAMRALLDAAQWRWVGFWLALALLAHLCDLGLRLRNQAEVMVESQ